MNIEHWWALLSNEDTAKSMNIPLLLAVSSSLALWEYVEGWTSVLLFNQYYSHKRMFDQSSDWKVYNSILTAIKTKTERLIFMVQSTQPRLGCWVLHWVMVEWQREGAGGLPKLQTRCKSRWEARTWIHWGAHDDKGNVWEDFFLLIMVLINVARSS